MGTEIITTSAINWTQIITAFMGVVGTLAGVFTGYISSRKIHTEAMSHSETMQKNQLLHSDKTRFLKEKMDLYSTYASDVSSCYIDETLEGEIDSKLFDRYISKGYTIRLLADPKLSAIMLEIHDLYTKHAEYFKENNGPLPEEMQNEFSELLSQFLVVAKEEIEPT